MKKMMNNVRNFWNEKKGDGFVDVALKILIVVVIGAAILAIMNVAMPGLFQGLIDTISDELTGIDIIQ
jgi:hypothetical protein